MIQPLIRNATRAALSRALIPRGPATQLRRTYRTRVAITIPTTDVITIIARLTRPCTIRSILPLSNQGPQLGVKTDLLISADDLTDPDAAIRDTHASLLTGAGAGFSAHDRAQPITLNLPVSQSGAILKILNHAVIGTQPECVTVVTVDLY